MSIERPLSAAINTDDLKFVNLILDHGAVIDVVPLRWERPVLLLAAKNQNIEITQALLKCGANPHVKDQSGRGALHWLVHGGDLGIAKIYVDLGLSPASKDVDGASALSQAVKYNDPDMVRECFYFWAKDRAEFQRGENKTHRSVK